MKKAFESFSKNFPKNVFVLGGTTTLVASIYIFREVLKEPYFTKEVDCKGKIAIVTGANTGIGKETAKGLAKRGATVFLLCRDKLRCDKARKEIVLQTKNKYVYSRVCDLSSLASIREFAEKFNKEEKQLDILINNAAVYGHPNSRTEDGFEMHLGVNYLGHFYLTNLLLDLLIASAPSRIINVNSVTHCRGEINQKDLNSDTVYSKEKAYDQSKLAMTLFTKSLSEKLQGTGVTANSVHPGASDTELRRRNNPTLAMIYTRPLAWLAFKSPEGGAQASLHAALDPDLEKVTGKYFSNMKDVELGPKASDPVMAKWLWQVSEKWTRLDEYRVQKQAAAP